MYIYFPNISQMIISPKLEHRVKDDGTVRVYIYLYDPRTRVKDKISTPFFVRPADWEGAGVERSNPSSKYINAKLSAITSQLVNHSVMNPGLSPAELKLWYSGSVSETYTPVAYFRHYIDLCEKGVIKKKRTKEKLSSGYCRALGTSAALLEKYEEVHPVNWSRFGEDFYDSYVSFLRELNYKQNYIAKAISYLTIMARHAKKKGVHTNEDLEYSIAKEKVQKIRLGPEEVEAIINLNLRDFPELIPEWERFQVAYNLLLRFGDTIAINKKNIISKKGRFYLTAFTQKTKKEILLPLKASVYSILRKNNFKLQGTNSGSNEKLKQLGMMAGINDPVTITEFRGGKKKEIAYKKYQLIETHTTRRSAARNLYDSGMDPLIIMTLGGWSSLKQLLDYIDIDLDYAASKAADHPFFN